MWQRLMVVLLLAAAGIPAGACTAFCARAGGKVLLGNNEDFKNPRTRVWFVPAAKGSYGRLVVGFDNGFPQGGMNEHGLAFDGFATAPVAMPSQADKQMYFGSLGEKALAECATVEEVIRLFEPYSRADRGVLLFADRHGDAVAIEPTATARKKDWYFVQTNFYRSRVKAGEEPCERYKIAGRMLEAARDGISVDLFRRILAATHQEGSAAATQYSNIYDLEARVMYLYHFHNFENVVRIDLKEELRKGARVIDIPSLFPRTHAYEAHVRWYEKEQVK